MVVQNILVGLCVIAALGYLVLRWFFPNRLQAAKKGTGKNCGSQGCGCS